MEENKFRQYREQYPEFLYKSYDYKITDEIDIIYHFEIPNLKEFNPELKIPIKKNNG